MSGSGKTLLIVHGGTGDRSRWTPLFPLLSSHMQVCAMDRRAHGQSGVSPVYSLEREARDVATVAGSFHHPITVLGHSYGGVAALEAALKTNAIEKLALYEPPLQDGDHSAAAAEIRKLLSEGRRDEAAETFLTKVVRISPTEVRDMKGRAGWAKLTGSMDTVLRQNDALSMYRWLPERFARLNTPTLLLIGERTRSEPLRRAVEGLKQVLPKHETVMLAGQEHNAMDTGREALARVLSDFVVQK